MAYILLAEDDRNLAGIFRKWLENEGHEVSWVENGAEGLGDLVHKRIPDLLVTDVFMPRADGEILTLAFNNLAKGQPVLVVTASPDDSTVAHLREEKNVKGVLRKPVSCDQLVTAVAKALDV